MHLPALKKRVSGNGKMKVCRGMAEVFGLYSQKSNTLVNYLIEWCVKYDYMNIFPAS